MLHYLLGISTADQLLSARLRQQFRRIHDSADHCARATAPRQRLLFLSYTGRRGGRPTQSTAGRAASASCRRGRLVAPPDAATGWTTPLRCSTPSGRDTPGCSTSSARSYRLRSTNRQDVGAGTPTQSGSPALYAPVRNRPARELYNGKSQLVKKRVLRAPPRTLPATDHGPDLVLCPGSK